MIFRTVGVHKCHHTQLDICQQPTCIHNSITIDSQGLAAGLPPQRPGFVPGSVHVGFVVDRVALGQVLPPSPSVFSCQFHSTGASLLGRGQKIIIIIIFITGLHNKPQGCSASVACAAGPFTTKKKHSSLYLHRCLNASQGLPLRMVT
jgi:hypothetical protein